MEFAAHQLAKECLACALETQRDIQSLPYLEDQPVGRKLIENRDFFNIKVERKKKLIVINYVFGINHNKRLTNFFKRCHRVNKNSPNKKVMEMSLSSSGTGCLSLFFPPTTTFSLQSLSLLPHFVVVVLVIVEHAFNLKRSLIFGKDEDDKSFK